MEGGGRRVEGEGRRVEEGREEGRREGEREEEREEGKEERGEGGNRIMIEAKEVIQNKCHNISGVHTVPPSAYRMMSL